jgi:hypothetical protein
MNLVAIRRELDRVRKQVFLEGAAGEVLPEVTRIQGKGGDWHCIQYSALEGHDVNAVIRAQVAHYNALDVEMEWTVYSHDHPADLRQRLLLHGFQIGPRENVVVLDLREAPAWVQAPLDARVERVTTFDGVQAFRRVSEQVFDSAHERIARELWGAIRMGSNCLRGYIAYADELPASIGRLYTHPDSPFGGLYGGGTLQRFRGRGLYRANVAARAKDAAELGVRYLRVDALPTSYPILERLGFLKVSEAWPCLLPRPSGVSSPAG